MEKNPHTKLNEVEPVPHGVCWNCMFIGRTGTNSAGKPIAWCHNQHLVVAPELGCRNWALGKRIQEEHDETH